MAAQKKVWLSLGVELGLGVREVWLSLGVELGVELGLGVRGQGWCSGSG